MTITRRAALAATLLAARDARSAAVVPGVDAFLPPLRDAAAALDGPGLLRSYRVRPGGSEFDRTHAATAYTYDNAMAGLALLSAGERALAERIGDALLLAQAQDRHWTDGRLRNAYPAGRMFEEAPRSAGPPGWWDAARGAWLEDGYAAGSATGPVAFAALLWISLDAPRFRDAAHRALDWVARDGAPPAGGDGFTGGTIGHEPAPERQLWRSTEQNLDLAVAFARLGRQAEAASAERFVRAQWRPAEGRFGAGRRPDGAADATAALDANLWPLLAWNDPAHRPALDWVLSRHGLPAGAPAAELDGLDFNDDRDGVWSEGTAQAVPALRRAGRGALADRFLRGLAGLRDGEGWVRASSVPWLTTGFRNAEIPFLYPDRGHLAASAWAVLAANDANPFGR